MCIEVGEDIIDFVLVVKFFILDGGVIWFLIEIDLEDEDIVFGFCDFGIGYFELGLVCFSVFKVYCGCFGLLIEWDFYFNVEVLFSIYVEGVCEVGGIVI